MALKTARWHRVKSIWRTYRWLVVTVLGVVSLIAGTVGWHEYYLQKGQQPQSWLTCIYDAIGLFTFSVISNDPVPWPLNVARFIAPLALAATIAAAVTAVVRAHWHRFRAMVMRDRLLVVGAGPEWLGILTRAKAERCRCVALDLSPGLELAPELALLGVPVIPATFSQASTEDSETLRRALTRAKVKKAREIVVVSGGDDANARIARQIDDLLGPTTGIGPDPRDHRGRIRDGHRIFVESSTLGLTYWLADSLPRPGIDRIEWFNVKERGARALLDEMALSSPALDPGITTIAEGPVLLLVGFTETCAAIVAQFGQLWAASVMLSVRQMPRVHIVDGGHPRAKAGRHLVEEIKADWDDMSRRDGAFRAKITIDERASYEWLQVAFDVSPATIVVALEDDTASLGAARRLWRSMPEVAVWVCANDPDGIASFAPLEECTAIRIFSMDDQVLSMERIRAGVTEDLARALQSSDYAERMRRAMATTSAGCRRQGGTRDDGPGGDSGDPAAALWLNLDHETRELNRAAVDGWRTALDRIGLRVTRRSPMPSPRPHLLTLREIEYIAEHLHEAWRLARTEAGWVYGTTKSVECKTHPHLIPWATLREDVEGWNHQQAENLQQCLALFDYVIEVAPFGNALVDKLARAYWRLHSDVFGADSSAQQLTWTDPKFSEITKDENRKSAREIPRYLEQLGVRVVPANTIGSPLVLPHEAIERLARQEHERWARSKSEMGWRLGDRKSLAAKIHPDLRPWIALGEQVRNKDRARIEAIPSLIADASLEVTSL